METLIFFYRSRSTPESMTPYIREFYKKDYRLVRIGLSAEAVALLERNELPTPKNTVSARKAAEKDKPSGKMLPQDGLSGKERGRWREGAGKKNDKHTIARLREKLFPKMAKREREKRIMCEKRLLLQKIQEVWGDELTTYCVCTFPITYFNRWRFSEFRDTLWIERLLYGAELSDFLILGCCTNLREILFLHARRMKSLKICVTEREYGEELEKLAEELLKEYGLMVSVRILTERENYRKLEKLMSVRCNVLDFAGEKHVNPHLVPPGSIWFDMDADEEKRREFEEKASDIAYKSLTVP